MRCPELGPRPGAQPSREQVQEELAFTFTPSGGLGSLFQEAGVEFLFRRKSSVDEHGLTVALNLL